MSGSTQQPPGEAPGPLEPEQASHLLEALPVLVWTCDHAGACTYGGRQWRDFIGLPEPAPSGEPWFSHLHGLDLPRAERSWARAVAMGARFTEELRLRRHDGAYCLCVVRAVPHRDAQESVTRWCCTATEVATVGPTSENHGNPTDVLRDQSDGQTHELEHARRRLEATAAQLKAAQRITQVGSWDLDLSNGEVVWSEELYRIFGLDPSQPPPNYEQQAFMFTEESWQRLNRAIERSQQTGEGYELKLTALRSDGSHRIAIAGAEVLRDAEGNVAHLVGTLQDISERERVADQMARLTERLQIAASAARIGVFDWDLQENKLVWDATMHELYGITYSQFKGSFAVWRRAIHPEDVLAVEAALDAAIEDTADFTATFRVVHPSDTSIKHMQITATVHRDSRTGKATRIVGINRDITARRVAELALRESEAIQRAVLKHAGSAIIATTRRGIVTLFNRAAELLLGYRAEEILGGTMPISVHVHEELEARRHVLEAELGRSLRSPFDVLVCKAKLGKDDTNEWTYIRKDGTSVPVLLTISALLDEQGAANGFLGIAADLTHQKQEEHKQLELNRLLTERSAQAESASHAKSAFVANISHEIRTPLGAITGVAYLLSKTTLSGDQRELLQTLDRSARTLLGMVNDVLDLSKIEAEQLDLDIAPFWLLALADDLTRLMAVFAVGKDVELELDVSPDLPDRLIGDRGRVMQILTNLASNAIKFTTKGEVRVRLLCVGLEADSVRLRIEVSDTGPGIDPETLGKLFNRFTQAEPTTTGARPPGTGLGLAIVKQLATLMGGSAGAESTVGKGSLFWCELALEVASDVEARGPSRLKVLVVDDQESQRIQTLTIGRRFGWEIDCAESGKEAVTMVGSAIQQDSPYDAVILDWKMPGMDGLDTLALMEERWGQGQHRPSAVLTTAHDTLALRAHPRIALTEGILPKPATPSSLFDVVTRAVARRSGSPAGELAFMFTPPESQRLAGFRVLVADDSDINRDIAGRILQREGAVVETAENGAVAVQQILNALPAYDAVLMDVQMPEMDGIQAVAEVRKTISAVELPIIALTAGALASERKRALDAGMNDFIAKPFDPDALVARCGHVARTRGPARSISPPPSPTSEAWPVVDGINAQDASHRLGGDADLFLMLLGRFVAELERFTSDLADLSSNPEGLAARVHMLRGKAGNMGASRLHRIASELEEALRAGDLDRVGEIRTPMGVEVDRLLTSARQVLAEASGPESLCLNAENLATLRRHLEEQSLEALSDFHTLARALEAAFEPSSYAQFTAAVENFDFTTALQLLDNLRADVP